MKIATYNANSIRARLDLLLAWIDRHKPDVLCVQETKVQDKDFPLEAFKDAGYQVTFKGQKSYAGVATISKQAPEEKVLRMDEEPQDARFIATKVDSLWVINTYAPQGRELDSEHFQYKLKWFSRFADFLRHHHDPSENLLWCGDLNVAPSELDVHDPKRLKNHVDFHPDARAALQKVMDWGLSDAFRKIHPDEPGHFSFWDYRVPKAMERGLGWRIDHVMVTSPILKRVRDAWIDTEARREPKPSDHTFLVVDLDL